MEQTSAKREKRKSLLRIAIPIILSSCLQISYDITDMFWVGKLGSGEVAAVGTAGFYIKLGWSLISVITIGTMISVSHSIGAEKKDRIQHFISCGIRSTFVLGIFYALFVFMLAEPLISLFNIERPEVNTMAQNYLRISSITVLIMFMNLLFTAIIDAHGKTQFSFRAVLYGNIVNIILDPLFIFYFGLGVEGAAWATALSQGCAMMYAVYLLRHRLELTLSIKAVPHKFLRKILGIGTAPAMQRILFSLIGIAIGRIVSIWGTDAIAAQKLGLQIESLSFLLMNGLMQATSILIGQYYGERNTDMIRKCYRTSIRLGYCISIPATFIFLAFPETILSFFVNEAATIEIGSAYLRIVGFSQLFATLEILTSGAYTGQGLTKYPATVSIVFTTMRIPLALLLGKSLGMGIEGVWWSISLTSVIKGIVLYLLYRKREKELEKSNIQYSSI